MQEIIQCVINGTLLGGLYGVIGIGMSLVFGIMGLTNLAHGDLMIFSTYISMVLLTQFTHNIVVALLLSIIVMIIIGYLFQTFMVNKVLDKGDEPSLLITFGLSIILANTLLLIFGADARTINTSIATSNIVSTDFFSISMTYVIDFVAAILVILGINYLLNKTYFGRAIRASSDDVNAAELMGVDTKKFYSYSMCLALITSTIAGLLVGMTFVFYPSTGTQYLIIAFGVVVIGGMGSLVGTMVGGLILGLAQLLGSQFFGTGYQLLAGYIVILLILTFKPEGLLANASRK